MKQTFLLLAILCLSAPSLADSLDVDAGSYVTSSPTITWWGGAVYTNDAGDIGYGVAMSGNLALYDSWGDMVDNESWSVITGQWSDEHTEDLYWDDCFTPAVNAQTFDLYAQKYGSTACNPQPPVCDPSDPNCGGGGYCDVSDPGCCDPTTDICNLDEDPVVINLSGGEWRLTGLIDPVQFDIRAVGHKDTIGWTGRSSNLAFLALDRNGNGVIDDGSELFGTAMPLPNGQRAKNGFDALAQFDGNGDGRIDASDAIWGSLLLWVDQNHDGVCQPYELQHIAQTSITSIDLTHHWLGRRDVSGNVFRYQSRIQEGDRFIPFYDIFFVRRR